MTEAIGFYIIRRPVRRSRPPARAERRHRRDRTDTTVR